MGILSVLGFGRPKSDASDLYALLVSHARRPIFYTEMGVPDTANGRFDVIMLHAYFVMRRLKEIGSEAGDLSQALFDYMFADMDKNLREMGVGDLSVGKKVKAMATAYYGRIKAYDEGLEQDHDALLDAVRRNIYAEVDATDGQLSSMANYLNDQVMASSYWTLSDIENAKIDFLSPNGDAQVL